MAASRSDSMSEEEFLGWDYSELDSSPDQTDGLEKCGHPNCKNCKRINSEEFFTGLHDRTSYKVPRKIQTCQDSNVVYLLTDPKGYKYVGKTTQSLSSRMNGHRYDIYNADSGSTRRLEKHFTFNKQLFEKIKVQIIDYAKDPEELARKEKKWINVLGTCDLQKGLNSQH